MPARCAIFALPLVGLCGNGESILQQCRPQPRQGLTDLRLKSAKRLQCPVVGEDYCQRGVGNKDVSLDVLQAGPHEVERVQAAVATWRRGYTSVSGGISHGGVLLGAT